MILVINESKKDAVAIAETFYYMGLLSRGISPCETAREINELYRAIIIANPDYLPDKEELTAEIRGLTYAPVYAITNANGTADRYIFDATFKNEFYSSRIYDYVLRDIREKKKTPPGIYKLGEIDASANLSVPLYRKRPLPFTKSESMILRILIKSYPSAIKASDILKYAFRQSRLPDISNIRTHISIMNKKFTEISGVKLIDFIYNKGYKLTLGESL